MLTAANIGPWFPRDDHFRSWLFRPHFEDKKLLPKVLYTGKYLEILNACLIFEWGSILERVSVFYKNSMLLRNYLDNHTYLLEHCFLLSMDRQEDLPCP